MSILDNWKLVPLGVRLFVPHKNKVINSNSFGFRTHEFDFSNKKVIIILGGSAAWGLGASSDERTFPFLLEKKIKEENNQYIVINLSMMAATSQQELLYLIFWGLKLNPEIVISFSGFNDLVLPNKFFDEKNNLFILPDILKYKKNYENIFSTEISTIKRFLFLFKKPSEVFNLRKDNLKINFENRSDVFLKSNQLISNFSKLYNFKLYTILQPNGFNKKKTNLETEQLLFYLEKHGFKDEYNQAKNLANEKSLFFYINKKKKSSELFFDYENLFDNELNTVFTDGIVHLNDFGHLKVSEKIYRDLALFD